tara:strand:+ start:6923 stop:7378 length:456 start_codon:yes stop_codon:yes gene_type:complete
LCDAIPLSLLRLGVSNPQCQKPHLVSIVDSHFYDWCKNALPQTIKHYLIATDQEALGQQEQLPSAVAFDNQSVKRPKVAKTFKVLTWRSEALLARLRNIKNFLKTEKINQKFNSIGHNRRYQSYHQIVMQVIILTNTFWLQSLIFFGVFIR